MKQRMHYDDAHRLVKVEILNDHDWREVAFSYDALGRRTEKTAWRAGKPEPQKTVYEWSGMRLCGEHNEKTPSARTLYLYEEESWQPLARVDSYSGGKAPQQRVLYYHTQPNGCPQCMTDSEGQTVWRARMWLWGRVRHEERSDIYSMYPEQNLRFAGQYLDRETGLHYNTLRYFLPESGRFSQPDPVGLAGGINLYAYAPNPLSWIDPLGLSPNCNLKWGNPKSKPTYGHTFSEHGQKMKPNQLIDRARNKGHQVGQYLDDNAAADFIASVAKKGEGVHDVSLPTNIKGRGYLPNGTEIVPEMARVIVKSDGSVRTSFPFNSSHPN